MIKQHDRKCVCGHEETNHGDVGCFGRVYDMCHCKQFKLDNLKYLEELSERSAS